MYLPLAKIVPRALWLAAATTLVTSAQLPAEDLQSGATVQSEEGSFVFEVVADGLRQPWGMVKLPDGRFLVTEKRGDLRVIQDGKLQEGKIANVPAVADRGQGGLMDLELHPDYANNGWIYISYSEPREGSAHTKIIRAKLKDNALTDIETIFEAPADQYTKAGHHFGNRMEFDKQNFLYFTIGERGEMEKAQRLDMVQGKVHRLHDDGKVPADNPFVNKEGAMPSIWTYGNRNPQGMRIHPKTGVIWETEHGPKGGDELNILKKGANYGWPLVTYGINYNGKPITDKQEAPGIEPPVIHWTPSIAVAGMDFYMGDKMPKWKGNLFVSALAHQKLVRVVVDGTKVTHQEILLEGTGRMRDVRCFDDGFVYIVYDQPGRIVRLKPAS